MSSITEKSIQKELKWYFINYEYKLFNSFIYNWESDFFGISKSGYATEVEIKVSKSDFKKDFVCKLDKHHLLANCDKKIIVDKTIPFTPYLRKGETEYQYRIGDASSVYFCNPKDKLPNKFYYCVPEGLITKEECPKYAGLIYYYPENKVQSKLLTIKPAPFLHKQQNKLTSTLLSKFYHRSLNLKSDLNDLINSLGLDIDYEGRLTQYEKEKVKNILNRYI